MVQRVGVLASLAPLRWHHHQAPSIHPSHQGARSCAGQGGERHLVFGLEKAEMHADWRLEVEGVSGG